MCVIILCFVRPSLGNCRNTYFRIAFSSPDLTHLIADSGFMSGNTASMDGIARHADVSMVAGSALMKERGELLRPSLPFHLRSIYVSTTEEEESNNG